MEINITKTMANHKINYHNGHFTCVVTRVKNSVYLDIYICIHPWILVTQECHMRLRNWYVVDGILLMLILKQIDLVLIFLPLYRSLRCCLHHLNTEAGK